MRHAQRGFGLIEIMIAVVIVGILAAIAFPSYQNQVLKTRRSDAKVGLSDVAQRLERCYTQFGRYNADDCTVSLPLNSPEGHYQITGNLNAADFALTATPKGAQAKDADCTSLSLSSDGTRDAEGKQADSCW